MTVRMKADDVNMQPNFVVATTGAQTNIFTTEKEEQVAWDHFVIKFVASCFSLPLQYVDEDILEHFSFCGHTALETTPGK